MKDNNQTPLISVKNLTKKFGNLMVLDDVSLDIYEGEKVVVLGPSGGGKSTFLRCLNCLEDPTSGHVIFDGTDLCDLHVDINKQREKMVMVFQQYNLFNNLTVLENITLAPILIRKKAFRQTKIFNTFLPIRNACVKIVKPLHDKIYAKRKSYLEKKIVKYKEILAPIESEWESTKTIEDVAGKTKVTYDKDLTKKKFKYTHKIEKAEYAVDNLVSLAVKEKIESKYSSKNEIVEEAKSKAYALLDRIGLTDKADAYPSTLSGGQKQRIAIVRALAMEPKVLLFDEPTSALDPEMVGEVLSLIRSLADDGMTMIIVTHEIGFAREVGTRILFMDGGKIAEDQPPKEFFTEPKVERLKEFLSKVISQ